MSRRTAVAASLALALAAAGALAGCGDDAVREYVGYRQVPSQQVGALALPDASAGGAPARLVAESGQLLVVYFGFTACPDVCPTTLSGLRQALRDLGDESSRIDLAMVTVDPARDTDEVLTGYVQSFVDDAHALRTTDDALLRSVTDAFGASYRVTTAADGTVEVAHTGAMYVVDPTGTVTLTWPFGVTADDLRDDLAQLLEEYQA